MAVETSAREKSRHEALMDEGSVDLTVQKTKKASKIKKAKKQKPERKDSKGKENTKGSVLLWVLGVFLFFTISLGTLFVLVYFNVFDLKLRVDEFMGFSETAYAAEHSVMNDREKRIEIREQDIKDRENMLSVERRELDKRMEEIQLKESEIAEKEAQVDRALAEAEVLKAQLEKSVEDIAASAALISKMEAESAVGMLNELEDMDYLVRLFKVLKADKQAELLAAMDPARAAAIFSAMGNNQ